LDIIILWLAVLVAAVLVDIHNLVKRRSN